MNLSIKCKNRREIQSGQEQSRDIEFFLGGVCIHIYITQIYMLLLLSHFIRVRLCDPIDGSPPGSPVPGILQARTLEWVAVPFSNAWKWKVKVKLLSRVQLLATPRTSAHQAPLSMGFFQARVLEWGAIAFSDKYIYDSCNPMDYSLPGSSVHGIHQARILEWVAIPFSRGSSRPRDWTWVSCIAGRFFTTRDRYI